MKKITEEPLVFAKALVVDINDPDQKGKIKVRLLPEMENAKESHLPWYEPFFGTGNSTEQKQIFPKVNSNIIVMSMGDTKRNGYYIVEDHIEGFFDYSKISTQLGTMTDSVDTTYKYMRYNLNEAGNLYFENINTGETGILHTSGSYVIFNSSGDIILNGTGNKIIIKNNAESIKTLFDDLIDEIKAIVTVGSPASQTVSPSSQALLETVKTRFGNLLEE